MSFSDMSSLLNTLNSGDLRGERSNMIQNYLPGNVWTSVLTWVLCYDFSWFQFSLSFVNEETSLLVWQ